MSEYGGEFGQSIAYMTEDERRQLKAVRPTGFQADALEEMHKSDIAELQNELEALEQHIRDTRTDAPEANVPLFRLGFLPQADPTVIYPVAMQRCGIPLTYKGSGGTPQSEGMPATTTTGQGEKLWHVYGPARAEELHNIAGTEQTIGILIKNTLEDGYINLQAANLDPAKELEHARHFDPAINRDEYHKLIRDETMAKFFLSQQVLDAHKTDALLWAAHNEQALLNGELPPDGYDIPVPLLENAYARYKLGEKGVKPFSIEELITIQAEVYQTTLDRHPELQQ